jgi:hypothetical protein
MFVQKSCRLWDNVEKYGGARGHKWRQNMARTRWMLDKHDYMDDTPTLPGTHTHIHTYARTRTHTNRNK